MFFKPICGVTDWIQNCQVRIVLIEVNQRYPSLEKSGFKLLSVNNIWTCSWAFGTDHMYMGTDTLNKSAFSMSLHPLPCFVIRATKAFLSM